MSDFKKEFVLKQHTPMIHFQSDQSGATLRATELKPKFDRFLLEQVEGIPFVKNANGSKSLDYKVKIEPDLSSAETIETLDRRGREQSNPLFFGNMGDGEYKKFKQHRGGFKIEFFSFNSVVLEAIKNNFEAFLVNTNFGTRQSKGFGSFYIDGKSFNKDFVNHKVYSFSSSKASWDKDIKLFYSFLRQGINIPRGQGNCPETRFYTKPAIFSYAKSKGWVWDKKAIKEAYFPQKLRDDIECRGDKDVLTYSSENKFLLRDLFGLSSSQEWMSYGRRIITKEGVSTERDDTHVVKIQRFKSPITFKPILDDDNETMTIYFWANDTVNDILNEEFRIQQNNRGNLTLFTPPTFSFDDFFNFTFNITQLSHLNPSNN